MLNPDNNISRIIKPNIRSTDGLHGRTRPTEQPKNDFKRVAKAVDDDKKEEREDEGLTAVDDLQEERPSVFDLSANSKTKNKLAPQEQLDNPSELREQLPENPTLKKSSKQTRSTSTMAQSASNSQFLEEPGQKEITDPFLEEYPYQDENSELSPYTTLENPADSELNMDINPDLNSEVANANQLKSNVLKEDLAAKELLRQDPSLAGLKSSKSLFGHDALLETGANVSSQRTKSKVNTNARLDAQENPDIAYLNPNPDTTVNFQTEKIEEKQTIAASRTIREIVEQIVEGIRTIKTTGMTETIITLKQPPMFEGVDIHLTTLDTAKRDLNIVFTKLSVEAKQFLDQRMQQDSLTQALEQKGFIVQTLITTTQWTVPTGFKMEEQWVRSDREQQQRQQKEDSEEENA